MIDRCGYCGERSASVDAWRICADCWAWLTKDGTE